mmetsp:Transcript_44422/g.125752  ORF Transcript_44422/g.125752 Transcript_44422/m.125752 type:complete len:253 (-) Transcript_44422:360-1118(-)
MLVALLQQLLLVFNVDLLLTLNTIIFFALSCKLDLPPISKLVPCKCSLLLFMKTAEKSFALLLLLVDHFLLLFGHGDVLLHLVPPELLAPVAHGPCILGQHRGRCALFLAAPLLSCLLTLRCQAIRAGHVVVKLALGLTLRALPPAGQRQLALAVLVEPVPCLEHLRPPPLLLLPEATHVVVDLGAQALPRPAALVPGAALGLRLLPESGHVVQPPLPLRLQPLPLARALVHLVHLLDQGPLQRSAPTAPAR